MRVNQTCGEARRLSGLARTVQRQKAINVKPTSFSPSSGLLGKQGDVPATGKPTRSLPPHPGILALFIQNKTPRGKRGLSVL